MVGGTAAALGCSSSGGASEATGIVAAGDVGATAVGRLAFVPGSPLIRGRDAGGLYAMTSVCTHLRCDVSVDGLISASGVDCNCHGPGFTATGAVAGGPARSPLQNFQVQVGAGGAGSIDASAPVDSATRAARLRREGRRVHELPRRRRPRVLKFEDDERAASPRAQRSDHARRADRSAGRYGPRTRTAVEVDDLDDEDREKLHAAIRRGIEQGRDGDARPIEEALAEIRARR